jgi:hypothetical protein
LRSQSAAAYEGELDVDAATRQVARLVSHLEDPNNLVTLSRRKCAKLF